LQILDCSLIYISDVHLKHVDDERSLLLLDCLSRLESNELEVVVLGGDIFDFCFGASRYFRDKFQPFQLVLEALVRRGTRVIFLQGNHEFSIGELGWAGVEFITSHHTTLTLTCGTKFGLSHGDRFLADWSYRAYLALTRSWPWKWGAKLVPAKALDDFALKCSGYSRDRGEYRNLNFQKVVTVANEWIANIDVDHGIFGHFHFPFCSDLNTGRGKLVSVESWQRPNLLIYRDESFFRVYPSKAGGDYAVEPVTDRLGI
jgi:UDP-2,3-diacylglucosamine hydrolase